MGRKIKFENKKELILNAASKLFSQYGFDKTTLDDIAKEAGIGKGTIYTEFESKEDIFQSVVIAFLQSLTAMLEEADQTTKNNYLEAIRKQLVKNLLMGYDHAKSHIHGTDIMSSFRPSLRESQAIEAVKREADVIIARMLEKAAKNKEITPQNDYLKTAVYIDKCITAFLPPLSMLLTREETEEQADEVLRIFLRGLK